MASTYSSLKIQLMATGENSGTWGNVTNVNLGTALEEAIVGSSDVTFASGTVTLTLTDTNSSQTARNLRLNLTGTSGGAQDLIVPAIEKVYIVNNGCADAITVKNSTGTGIAVPAGKTMYVYNNGTNVVDAITHLTSLTLSTPLPVASGGTGSNSATFSGANITALNAENIASGTLAVARGGTGLTASGTSGNVLTSNGTAFISSALPAGFPAGTVMLFGQTSAPTGFTKLVDQDNAALRVVSGSASSGGSVNFTTAFASQTPSGSVTISSISGSVGATTLSTAQIPSHNHSYSSYTTGGTFNTDGSKVNNPIGANTGNTGGGESHTHPFSYSSGSASFSGNAINLAVKYVDVIRASKD